MPSPASMVKLAKALGIKSKALDELASEFKKQTGDSIDIAATKLAAQNLRRSWGQSVPDYYTPEQVKMFEQYEAMRYPSSKHLFHTTPQKNLQSIAQQGLLTGMPPRFPDVSSPNKISLAANEGVAKYYGAPDDVMLRVSQAYKFPDLEADLLAGGNGAYLTSGNIAPDFLEVRQGKKWIPLKGLLGD